MFAESLEQPTVVALPTSKKSMFEIDENQLFWLREKKLITRGSAFDVFLCIQLSYGESLINLDVSSFCNRWELTESQVLSAIAQLQKKELIEPSVKQLEIQFIFD